MTSVTNNSRRDFIKMSAIAGGGLVLGFNWFSAEAATVLTADPAAALGFNSYLSIATDGTVTIMSPNPELGQNIMTSFPMIVAEELEADWTKVKVLQANLDNKFERQLTGGSGAVPHSWKLLRTAGATAKAMLVQAAASQWSVPSEECTASMGFVLHAKSGKKLSYGALAEAASKIPVPTDVKLKDRKDYKLIGTLVRNVENKKIVTGKPLFGLDFYREGMLYAMIQRPESFGMKVKSVDSAEAKAMPGIIDVVRFKDNVAVVGKSTWQVLKARKLLKVEYEKGGTEPESTEDHNKLFGSLMETGTATVRRKDGDVDAAFKTAAKVVKGEYQCPFLSHSPMEPMNFFADVRPDGVELVGPTQTPARARADVSKLLNVPENKITLELTRLGGGFGRRLQSDYATEAAELSSIMKAPIKLIWTKEDDMTGGVYRPAVRYRFEAALDASGNMIGYKLRGVGMNAGNSTRENNFPSGSVDNLLIDSVDHKSPITTGAWRAPITNFLAYAEQSFLDEVAHAAGKDPVAFRLELLERAKSKPVGDIRYNIDRMIGVIKLAAEKSGWGKNKNISQGFSVYFSHASYVAQVANVEMQGGMPVVKKIYAVSDCGQVVNLGGARQQVMGGVVDGLGHAMYSKLSFKDGAAEQRNYNSYRLIRMKEIPEIETHFVDNGIDPTGLGEPALPPTGGAVANAIFKATGKRLRSQPFIDQDVFKTIS